MDGEGKSISAVTYTVIRKSDQEIRPSAEYMERVIAGARACGLSSDYVELLTSIRDHPAGSAGASAPGPGAG